MASRLETTTLDRVLLGLMAASVTCVAMVWLRGVEFGQPGFRWMPLNLALAWVPLCASFAAWRARSHLMRWSALAAAILFLPNAPYVITDLIHLRVLPGIPVWFDATLLWSMAFTSALVGALAMRFLEDTVTRGLGGWSRWPFVGALSILCAYGIHLGRFGR